MRAERIQDAQGEPTGIGDLANDRGEVIERVCAVGRQVDEDVLSLAGGLLQGIA